MLLSSLAALVSISLMFLRQYLRFLSSLEFSSNNRGGSVGLILYTILVWRQSNESEIKYQWSVSISTLMNIAALDCKCDKS